MAASAGRQKSKFNFAQSVEESFTKSLSEESTPIESPKSDKLNKNTSNRSNIFKESIFKDPTPATPKKPDNEIRYDDEFEDPTPVKTYSDPHKIDIKQLRTEALTKQPSKSGNKAITFSVACKKNGELEKVIDVASRSFGFNRSLYIRSLIYNDYINNKEKYDRLLELS